MVGGDGVDRAVGEPRFHRRHVGVGTQGRVDLERGVERLTLAVGEREVVRRDLGRDRDAPVLRVAHEVDGGRGRQVEEVDGRAGELGEQDVPGDDGRFGRLRPARDPEAAGPRAFVHVPAGGERRVFGVLGDDGAGQRMGVLERAPHDAGVGDTSTVVGEDADTEGVELPHRRELPAATTLGDAARRHHVARRLAACGEHGRDDGGVVERRLRVRHGDDGGEASESGGAGAGFDRLRLFVAGLAQVGVQVDEAGHDEAPGGVEYGRAFDTPAHGGDDAALDEDVRDPVAGRVDDASAFDHELVRTVRQPDLPSRGVTRGPPSVRRPRWRPVP